jgi:hypothetical protein
MKQGIGHLGLFKICQARLFGDWQEIRSHQGVTGTFLLSKVSLKEQMSVGADFASFSQANRISPSLYAFSLSQSQDLRSPPTSSPFLTFSQEFSKTILNLFLLFSLGGILILQIYRPYPSA